MTQDTIGGNEHENATLLILLPLLIGSKNTFPDFRLSPKRHYVKHYLNLIKCFGPLVHVWTVRFEAKHCFYKTVVHGSQISKNILKTLAIRHQHIMHILSCYTIIFQARNTDVQCCISFSFNFTRSSSDSH